MSDLGLTPEEIKEVKDRIARETQEREQKERRDAALKNFLEGENAEVNKELYENGGMKAAIAARPEILDSAVALEYALKEAKTVWQKTFNPDPPPVEEEKKPIVASDSEIPSPPDTSLKPAPKSYDPHSMDMHDPQFLETAAIPQNEKDLIRFNRPKQQSRVQQYRRK